MFQTSLNSDFFCYEMNRSMTTQNRCVLVVSDMSCTFSRGSACCRNQPTMAWPASWYATVFFSVGCRTWVFFSRPEKTQQESDGITMMAAVWLLSLGFIKSFKQIKYFWSTVKITNTGTHLAVRVFHLNMDLRWRDRWPVQSVCHWRTGPGVWRRSALPRYRR